jgi:Effector-associated domain 1
MGVSRQQVKQAWKAFLSAFDYPELERLLYFLERDLNKIASSQVDFSSVCFELVREAEKDGWLEDLIHAAVDEKPRNEKLKQLVQDLGLDSQGANSVAGSIVHDNLEPDTSDPLLVIEDFRKDLEKIPAEQSWNTEEYEIELEGLQSWLPRLRTQSRSLVPQCGVGLEQSVLRELKFEDAFEDALTAINAFELCLNCLLDSSRPEGVLDQMRYVQWFRRKSRGISECLRKLQRLGANPGATDQDDRSSGIIYSTLSTLIQRLRNLNNNDASRLDERRQMLTADSGISPGLNAIIIYPERYRCTERENIELIRDLLVNVSGFIEHTVVTQKRFPSTPGSAPIFPQGEGIRLQKVCDEALDGLDLYNRINHELISSWEEVTPNGVAVRADPRDLYRARRVFIGKLGTLARRIAALVH